CHTRDVLRAPAGRAERAEHPRDRDLELLGEPLCRDASVRSGGRLASHEQEASARRAKQSVSKTARRSQLGRGDHGERSGRLGGGGFVAHRRSSPPSITTDSPVIPRAASKHRNATVSATSSGSMSRRCGTRLRSYYS